MQHRGGGLYHKILVWLTV